MKTESLHLVIKILMSFCIVIMFSGCRRSCFGHDQKIPVISKPIIVKMEEHGGVYEVPIKVNDTPMKFIFDTGASNVTISTIEAAFMIKQGTITESDVKGRDYFTDATGRVSEGAIINLRKLEIGEKIIENIEATVVNTSNAPLLLGQSALARFGKITIDYTSKTITFN